MEFLFGIVAVVAQFVGELLLQMVLEVLAEIGLYSVKEVFRRPRPASPVMAAAGYCILGAGAGGLSLLFSPILMIQHPRLQVANLVITPVVSGALMTLIGAWRHRRHQEALRLDRFSYGLLFALSTAAIRFCYAHPA